MHTTRISASAIVATALLLSGASLAFAQTSTTTGTTAGTGATSTAAVVSAAPVASVTTTAATGTKSTVVTPNTPNTGAGGEATTNELLLVASALCVALGATYLFRQRVTR